ncbi:MAG: DoxX family protein [Planctomycetota bacterium]|jgi:uncharacterized membrane protein|nr:DoxX family protein [Planctomycetota bacterium]
MLELGLWLWVAQGLLAAGFGLAGVMKSLRPKEVMKSLRPKDKLVERLPWAAEVSLGTIRFIGIVEIAGALGMVLPMVTGILPWLTPLAAIGFAVIQVFAIRVHARLGETAKSLPINFILLGLSVFVAFGRWDLFPF